MVAFTSCWRPPSYRKKHSEPISDTILLPLISTKQGFELASSIPFAPPLALLPVVPGWGGGNTPSLSSYSIAWDFKTVLK